MLKIDFFVVLQKMTALITDKQLEIIAIKTCACIILYFAVAITISVAWMKAKHIYIITLVAFVITLASAYSAVPFGLVIFITLCVFLIAVIVIALLTAIDFGEMLSPYDTIITTIYLMMLPSFAFHAYIRYGDRPGVIVCGVIVSCICIAIILSQSFF
jgi:hypothetical protein